MGLAAAVGRGDVLDTSAKPPESLLDPDEFIAALPDRDIDSQEAESTVACAPSRHSSVGPSGVAPTSCSGRPSHRV